jgi:hypothetical protein
MQIRLFSFGSGQGARVSGAAADLEHGLAAALRMEKLVAVSDAVLATGEAVAGAEEQDGPANTGVSCGSVHIYPGNTGDCAPEGQIYPKKPEDSCDQREIYPRSTRIYPSTAVKMVQGDIFFGERPMGTQKKTIAI